MIGIQQGIAQRVIFIGELDGGMLENNALFHAVVLGKGTGGDISDNDLQRHNGNLLHQSLAGIQLLDKVGGNALLFQHLHQAVAHLIVDNTLTGNGALFQAVECGGIVLVFHDQKLGIVGLEYFLCLSFVQLLQFFHNVTFSFFGRKINGQNKKETKPPGAFTRRHLPSLP